MQLQRKLLQFSTKNLLNLKSCHLSTSIALNKSYDLVVVGGGAGGCAIAAKFTSKLGKGNVAVIDPAESHYYQPMFTLIGGGMKTLDNSRRPMAKVLPKDADWIKEKCVSFDPLNNKVMTDGGKEISYKFLVVGLGMQLNYDKIPGLVEALSTPSNGVCSNYSPLYVEKTFDTLKNFNKGNAIFTFPNSPVKCAGAPQKIMYITEEYLRKNGKRNDANIIYNTSLGVIFGVKKYAESLWEVVNSRDINVNLRTNLIEVNHKENKATFQNLDTNETHVTDYSMLHVSPPMSAPAALKNSTSPLVDAGGFLNVNKDTLQHTAHPNIFGVGDCTNSPNAKTAAAVAGQVGVLRKNLKEVMDGKEPKATYDGYSSCPLVTGYSKCILAEFDYNLQPMETFPVNQGKERRTMFTLKKDFMPEMYWKAMLNGYWEGPSMMRSLLHLGMK